MGRLKQHNASVCAVHTLHMCILHAPASLSLECVRTCFYFLYPFPSPSLSLSLSLFHSSSLALLRALPTATGRVCGGKCCRANQAKTSISWLRDSLLSPFFCAELPKLRFRLGQTSPRNSTN